MEKQVCITCGKPKSHLECGICHEVVCKNCAQILPEDSFSFLPTIPAHLSIPLFCAPCFDQKVAADWKLYEDTMEMAKEVLVYYKKQGKETRLVKRFADPIQVISCQDHDETILRLAFLAAQNKFNALVDLEMNIVKVGAGSYQKNTYTATAIPAHIFPDKMIKDRSSWSNPN